MSLQLCQFFWHLPLQEGVIFLLLRTWGYCILNQFQRSILKAFVCMNSKCPLALSINTLAKSSLGKIIVQVVRVFPLSALAIVCSPHADIRDMISSMVWPTNCSSIWFLPNSPLAILRDLNSYWYTAIVGSVNLVDQQSAGGDMETFNEDRKCFLWVVSVVVLSISLVVLERFLSIAPL